MKRYFYNFDDNIYKFNNKKHRTDYNISNYNNTKYDKINYNIVNCNNICYSKRKPEIALIVYNKKRNKHYSTYECCKEHLEKYICDIYECNGKHILNKEQFMPYIN